MILRLAPADGLPPRALVILLHGVGADSASMLPLAQQMQDQLPQAAFALPRAALPSDLGPTGFQWFSVRGVTQTNRDQRIEAALPSVCDVIAEELAFAAVSPQQLVICGFSQGAMIALALADRQLAAAAVVSIAGRVARPVQTVAAQAPSILLTHGNADPVVAFACLAEAADQFRQAGFRTTELTVANLGHQISDQQARAVANFAGDALRLGSALQVA